MPHISLKCRLQQELHLPRNLTYAVLVSLPGPWFSNSNWHYLIIQERGGNYRGFRSSVMYALYSVIDFSFLLVSSPIVGLFTIFFNSILNPCFIRTRRWQVHWVRDWKGSISILDRIKHSKQVLPTWIWQTEQFNWRRFLVRKRNKYERIFAGGPTGDT